MGNTRRFFNLKELLIINCSLLIFSSCSIQQKISKSAKQLVLNDSSVLTAHVGICIYEPASGNYWYNYQGDKYFVPASNTKIPTCYAAMKYLGDSLVGLRYEETENYIQLYPTGDPTLLHKDFPQQRVFDFLSKTPPKSMFYCDPQWQAKKYGNGWAWNDFQEYYMAERSPLPIFGNVFTIKFNENDSLVITPDLKSSEERLAIYFTNDSGLINLRRVRKELPGKFSIRRYENYNQFEIVKSNSNFIQQEIPINSTRFFNIEYLQQTISHNSIISCDVLKPYDLKMQQTLRLIHSQPTDSLLKPMMHNSDNFFAEQSLLMVSNELLGVMNDAKIIDTLLKTDFKDLPQKPRWVDGSGLSRYNLFTPQDFVSILNKMKNEFGMERIKVILPTGGTGTISNYYKADSNYIFGKTGTLSGIVAFSGFLYTKKGKLLIFSTLVNNHQASSTAVRRAVEKFIEGIRNKY